MKCWICGDEASSGEHTTKASDLRAIFGLVSQKNPLYIHSPGRLNQKVSSVKSNQLKFNSLICPACNNHRTQPHDKAWEALSNYLRTRRPAIRAGSVVRLSDVFPGKVHSAMLDVHLYFIKLFGCYIVEHKIPLSVTAFSAALLARKSHPNVHISFEAIADRRYRKHAGHSPIQTAQLLGEVRYATWLYDVGLLSAHVMYSHPNEHRKGVVGSWHPDRISKLLKIIAK